MIDEYVLTHRDKAVGFTSLGQFRYLSALQYIDAVVGNSSSGLIEAPTFKIGTINISLDNILKKSFYDIDIKV